MAKIKQQHRQGVIDAMRAYAKQHKGRRLNYTPRKSARCRISGEAARFKDKNGQVIR